MGVASASVVSMSCLVVGPVSPADCIVHSKAIGRQKPAIYLLLVASPAVTIAQQNA